jgi:membrane-associated protease RseP (regulator of RpoE activity)
MIKKLTIALLLAVPAFAVAGEQPAQLHTSGSTFFYSAGRSYLGVDVQDVTSDRVSALKLKEERGVEITMVDQDAPAGKAGLKEHDVILDYNGTKVEGEEQLRRMIRETPPGRTVALGISRDGNPMTINVQLGDRSKLAANNLPRMGHDRIMVMPPEPPEPPDMGMPFNIQVLTYTPVLGAQVDNLGKQLAEYFGVKNGEGLLVKSVEKGSPGERAGLKAGDVITRIDNDRVTDRSDLRRVLRSHREGGKITLGIVRDKREQNLTVDLPSRKATDSSNLEFSMPDFDSVIDMKSLHTEIDRWIRTELEQLQPQLRKAQLMIREQIKPEIEKQLRNTQSQMREFQKQFDKQQKEWMKAIHKELKTDFI